MHIEEAVGQLPRMPSWLKNIRQASSSRSTKPASSTHVCNNAITPSTSITVPSTVNLRAPPTVGGIATTLISTGDDFWSQAYKDLEIKFPSLVKDYETILVDELKGNPTLATLATSSASVLGNLGTPKREEQMVIIMKKKVQEQEDSRLKIVVGTKTIMVRDQIEKLVKVVSFAKDFITSAVSSNPPASVAWSGICVLLPVSHGCTPFSSGLDC